MSKSIQVFSKFMSVKALLGVSDFDVVLGVGIDVDVVGAWEDEIRKTSAELDWSEVDKDLKKPIYYFKLWMLFLSIFYVKVTLKTLDKKHSCLWLLF